MKNLKDQGFTLIELLVVVLIIGILAAVALPQYNKAVKKAQGTEALTVIDALDKAMQAYYLEHGTYKDISIDALHVDIPEQKHVRYLQGGQVLFEQGQSLPKVYGSSTSQYGNNTMYSAYVYLALKGDVVIGTYWHDNQAGKSTGIHCSAYGSVSCSEYFNCNAEPIQVVDTGSGIKQVGGGCLLK